MVSPYGGESLSKYIRNNAIILSMDESSSNSLGREGKARALGGTFTGVWAALLSRLRCRSRRLLLSCGPLHPEKVRQGPKGALDPLKRLVTTSHPVSLRNSCKRPSSLLDVHWADATIVTEDAVRVPDMRSALGLERLQRCTAPTH